MVLLLVILHFSWWVWISATKPILLLLLRNFLTEESFKKDNYFHVLTAFQLDILIWNVLFRMSENLLDVERECCLCVLFVVFMPQIQFRFKLLLYSLVLLDKVTWYLNIYGAGNFILVSVHSSFCHFALFQSLLYLYTRGWCFSSGEGCWY